jgi:hypothetical protein
LADDFPAFSFGFYLVVRDVFAFVRGNRRGRLPRSDMRRGLETD